MLERMGHFFIIENDKQVMAVVLGWLNDLAEYIKCPGKKRKTLLYLTRLLREVRLHKNQLCDRGQESKESQGEDG